jgi:hypothetical protein
MTGEGLLQDFLTATRSEFNCSATNQSSECVKQRAAGHPIPFDCGGKESPPCLRSWVYCIVTSGVMEVVL